MRYVETLPEDLNIGKDHRTETCLYEAATCAEGKRPRKFENAVRIAGQIGCGECGTICVAKGGTEVTFFGPCQDGIKPPAELANS